MWHDVNTNCVSLQWRINDHDGVSNHQPHGCLLNRLFRRISKQTSKLCVTGFVRGIHRGPVTRKMIPFDDVIMEVSKSKASQCWLYCCRKPNNLPATWIRFQDMPKCGNTVVTSLISANKLLLHCSIKMALAYITNKNCHVCPPTANPTRSFSRRICIIFINRDSPSNCWTSAIYIDDYLARMLLINIGTIILVSKTLQLEPRYPETSTIYTKPMTAHYRPFSIFYIWQLVVHQLISHN